MYRVAITLSPSVTQKFMRLGFGMSRYISVNVCNGSEDNALTDLNNMLCLCHFINMCNCIHHGATKNVRRERLGMRIGELDAKVR